MSSFVKRLAGSVWLFPLVVGLVLIILTGLKISGTSLGIYHNILFGDTRDHSLILNQPLPVRSDEWLVTSQLIIAQDAAGYPRINQNIDAGRDMSLVGEAPYKEWSAAFRPQNLAFFVLPLEYAFAFKWWLLLCLIMVSCYFLVLRFFGKRRLLAALIGTAAGLSPFLFWWYGGGALPTVFYGIFIILVGMRIINREPMPFLKNRDYKYSQLVYVLGLAYLLIAFALILYPPFQIPVVIVVTAFLAGYFLEKHHTRAKLFSKNSYSKLGTFLISAVLAGLVVFAFINTRNGAIDALTGTVYPGKRVVQSGGTPPNRLLSAYLQPQLQREERAKHYYANQSEASNFILLLPFLFIPGFVLLFYEYKRTRKVSWTLLAIQLCALLFMMHLFVPGLQPLYKAFLLDKVPHVRLTIGLGFAGILQLLLVMKSVERLKLSKRSLNRMAGGYTLFCLAMLAWVGYYTRVNYSGFIQSVPVIAILAIFFSAIIFCFLSRRFIAGAALLLVFSAASVVHIHPLYRGLGPIYNSKVLQVMNSISKPDDTWATADSLYLENFALMSGRDSLTGVKPYPDVSYWRQVEGRKGDHIYNRYSHSLVVSVPNFKSPLKLIQPDFFEVGLTCSQFITSNVDFILDSAPIEKPCVKLKDKVVYPGATFFIYEVKPAGL